MPVAEDKPAIDAILLKVMEAVPFQLTTEAGVEEARQRFRGPPRAEVDPEVRSEDRVIDGPGGPCQGPDGTATGLHRRRGLRSAARRRCAVCRTVGRDVPVELHNAETRVHGYVGYDGAVLAATEAVQRGMNALRSALHSP